MTADASYPSTNLYNLFFSILNASPSVLKSSFSFTIFLFKLSFNKSKASNKSSKSA